MNYVEEARTLLEKWGEAAHFQLNYYESTDSTNEEVKRAAARGAAEGFAACADEQTAGKGRRGREWKSPAGEAVYFSFLLFPEIAPEHAPMLTLIMGLAGSLAVRELTSLPAQIKWPNDIVIGNKKICGILTEAVPGGGIVIGCGVNVNNGAFSEEIADRASSLFLEGGCKVSRGHLLALMLRHFYRNYRTFLLTENLVALVDEYNGLLVNLDREVRVEDPLGAYTGIARGISDTGELLVETEPGAVQRVSSGEVSVRGLYGYTL